MACCWCLANRWEGRGKSLERGNTSTVSLDILLLPQNSRFEFRQNHGQATVHLSTKRAQTPAG